MWKELKIFVVRTLLFVYIKFRIMKYWSKFCRLLWERKRTPVKGFQSISELVTYMRTLKWRMDTWKVLWDAVSHPEHVQWLADNDPGRFIGDCDDFAIYEADVINKQLKGDALLAGCMQRAFMLTIAWHDGRFGAHNVCLIQVQKDPCGPNEENFWCYMDYGYPSPLRKTIEEVIVDVLTRYTDTDTVVPMGWAVSDTDLTPGLQAW